MERMVALTGRASLTPAASQDSQQPIVAAKTPAKSATEQEVSAGKGAAERACERPAGLLPKHEATALQTEDGGKGASSAPSFADASGAPLMSSADSAVASESAPVADSGSAAVPVLPEAAGKPVTAKEAVTKIVHTGEGSVPHPTVASQGTSEADDLNFAMKLSLKDTEQGSEAAPSASTARSPETSMQPSAAGRSLATHLPEVSESHTEHPATAHAALTAGTPYPSLSRPAEGSQPAEELDHDFVVVQPEEAPGLGFEQVDMPKMGNESAEGSQDLTCAPAPDVGGHAQQASHPSEELAQHQAAGSSQCGQSSVSDPRDLSSKAAPAAVPAQSAGAAAAAEHVSAATTDANIAESETQQAPVLDERAKALLASLPKPSPPEGDSTLPPQPETAGLLKPHPEGEDAQKTLSGGHEKTSDDVEGQGPGRPGPAAASQHQIARAGSTKEAYLIQSFLDNASSQLTEHGLVSLHQVCSLSYCPLKFSRPTNVTQSTFSRSTPTRHLLMVSAYTVQDCCIS